MAWVLDAVDGDREARAGARARLALWAVASFGISTLVRELH